MGMPDPPLLPDERLGEELVEPAATAGPASAYPWLSLRTIAEKWGPNWATTAPPKRSYLLYAGKWASEAFDPPAGLVPLGRVGMLAAAGGLGKSWALTQLALSVATGTPWLGTYSIATPGRVLLVMGEEEESEILRRLHYAARLMRLDTAAAERAAANIVPLALSGCSAALTCEPVAAYGAAPAPFAHETALVGELLAALKDAGPWSLLIFDPLSRFAGNDAEKDNAAATRFIETLERLTKLQGTPTVLVAHHTPKHERQDDSKVGSTAARGASALTDGVRFMMTLKYWPGEHASGLTLSFTKQNYGKRPEPLQLYRDDANHGALRVATAAELADAAAAQAAVVAKRKRGPEAGPSDAAGPGAWTY